MVKRISVTNYTGVAKVNSIDKNTFLCETKAGFFDAKLASSCLVLPSSGDKVYIVNDENEHYIVYILASNNSVSKIAKNLEFNNESISFNTQSIEINSEMMHADINKLMFNIEVSKIFSKIVNFSSNLVQYFSLKKEETIKQKINNYDTVQNNIAQLETNDVKLRKSKIELEHKNVGSTFMKAEHQIKLDAPNINLG